MDRQSGHDTVRAGQVARHAGSPLAAQPLLAEPSAEQTVPIERLGTGAAVVRGVAQSRHPTIVTEGEAGLAVILDTATYQSLRTDAAAHELLHDLEQAIADADAGRVVDHDAVVQELRGRYAGRVPPTILRELDET